MIVTRTAIVLMIAAFLFGCSSNTRDSEVVRVEGATAEEKQEDQQPDVTIGPAHATVESIIVLKVNNASIKGGEVHWYINGSEDVSSRGFRRDAEDLRKGDQVQAVLVSRDKEYASNMLTIQNTPPVIRKSELLPAMPRESSAVTVELNADDLDGDQVSFQYQWTLNGNFAGEEPYLEGEMKRDDLIRVEVTPYDGEDYGRSIKQESRVYNSPPEVRDNDIAAPFDGKQFQYQIKAEDPDGDPLAYSLEKAPEGMTIDPATGLISWEVKPEDAGIYEIRAMISDGSGATIIVPVTTSISFGKEGS